MKKLDKKTLHDRIEEILINHKELGFLKSQKDAVSQLEELFDQTLKEVVDGDKNSLELQRVSVWSDLINALRAQFRSEILKKYERIK